MPASGWSRLISIHALLAESDLPSGETGPSIPISIHALLAESDYSSPSLWLNYVISIHALLAESDPLLLLRPPQRLRISIHALLAESDLTISEGFHLEDIFQSTLSLRRATSYPRWTMFLPAISIHALLAESDLPSRAPNTSILAHFNPRSPCGERPGNRGKVVLGGEISIHALLAESDTGLQPSSLYCSYFNPRSPCGERPPAPGFSAGRTPISIHALLAESDPWAISRHLRPP